MRAVLLAICWAIAKESVRDSVTKKFRNPLFSAIRAYVKSRSIVPGAMLLKMSMPGVCIGFSLLSKFVSVQCNAYLQITSRALLQHTSLAVRGGKISLMFSPRHGSVASTVGASRELPLRLKE